MKGTLKSRKRISELFNNGKRYQTASALVLFLEKSSSIPTGFINSANDKQATTINNGCVAVAAGKKLGSSPKRNRAKRRLRAAATVAGAPWHGFDVVLVAKARPQERSFTGVVSDMRYVASMLAQIRNSNETKTVSKQGSSCSN
jgi:ribonuclease P protein component